MMFVVNVRSKYKCYWLQGHVMNANMNMIVKMINILFQIQPCRLFIELQIDFVCLITGGLLFPRSVQLLYSMTIVNLYVAGNLLFHNRAKRDRV